MTRDCIDYESNSVYIWKKTQYQSGRPRKNKGKRVSFSDQENDVASDTLATTGSESSPYRATTSPGLSTNEGTHINRHPHGPDMKAKKNNVTPKERGKKHKSKENTIYPVRENEIKISNVLNIYSRTLSVEENALLSKGHNFCPTKHFNLFGTLLDVNKFS